MNETFKPARIRRGADVLHRVLEGEAVLVHLAKGLYFGLDEVGTLSWERIGTGATLDDLVDAVTAAYEIDRPRARADIQALLDDLEAQGLVVRARP